MAPLRKKGAILARVSTPEQAKDKKFSIPAQTESGRAYAEKHGISVAESAVYEDAITGKTESREGYLNLLQNAGLYDCVIIYDTSRIGRTELVSFSILHTLWESGLEIHASTRGLVEEGMLTSIEVVMAAEEVRTMKRRMFWNGVVPKAKSGKLPAGNKAYGYKYVKGTDQTVIVEDQAEIVRLIFKQSSQKWGTRKIADTLNREGIAAPKGGLWWHSTVADILNNPSYKGEYNYGRDAKLLKEPIIIPVPPIVDADLWHEAQPTRRGKRPLSGRVLVGHLRCGICGRAMSSVKAMRWAHRYGNKTGPKYVVYYKCTSDGTPSGSCGQRKHRQDELEPEAEAEVRRALADPATVDRLIAAAQEQNPVNVRAVEEEKRKDAAWLDAYDAGGITASELAGYRAQIRRRITELTALPEDMVVEREKAQQKARELPLRKLLDLYKVIIHVWNDKLEVSIGQS